MATKTETITLRVGPKLKAELEVAAAEVEMTVGEFVRHAIADYLRRLRID